MVFLHIDKKNCMDGNCDNIQKLDTYLGNKNNKTFILIFKEDCGPCNATRPEWTKIKNVLSQDFLNRDNISIAAIDYTLAEKLKNLKRKPSSFPTMRFIEGSDEESYEDSSIPTKDRTIDSFIEWIKLKTGEKDIGKSDIQYVLYKKHHKAHKSHHKTHKRYHNTNKRHHNTNKRHHKGGKWSLKYKRSINCNRPKGFSQKQHCKYGRK
uniref:Thioredoxin domain-containing protein n=1 Tax=viral metagenome TaxID=1070528 RepID=A0A6C0AQN9_9ZZZZ